MKESSFLERIEKKPQSKISNGDATVLLLHDIKSLLEQLADDKGRKIKTSWFRKIFK